MTETKKKTEGLQKRKDWEFVTELRASKQEDDGYRRLEALVVPWGEIESRGYGRERFQKNTFDEFFRQRGKSGTALQAGHYGEIIGVSERFEKTDDGLVMTFRVADTTSAIDAMRLVDAAVCRAVSPGFWPSQVRMQGDVTVFQRASLPHVSLEFSGAYPQAKVTDIRSEGIDTPRRDAWRRVRQRRERQPGG